MITTPLSWVATANVILEVGARPVFVDVDPVTRNLDLDRIEAAITPATRAILPVDLAGLPVDLDRLYAIAGRHRLRVIEDAAQAIGSRWRGTEIGARGDLIALSFHANKNITSGEGGALVLPGKAEVPLAEQLRLQGVVRSGEDGMEVELAGGKFNLTDVAARIGLGQLVRLEEFNARREQLARRYFERWDRALGCELPPPAFGESNWHMFQVVLPERTKARRFHRPHARGRHRHRRALSGDPPVPAVPRARLREGQFPHAERIGRSIATLPLFPAMQDTDVDRVCAAAGRVLRILRG